MTSSAAVKVETAVIGAGVVGLAVARALSAAAQQREVILIDRASTFGTETSSRNSEVVHGGLYYPTNSLKAKFCVRGRHLLYDFCETRHVPYNKCGKLLVGSDDHDNDNALEALYQNALKNGVHDLERISMEQVRDMEPQVLAPGGALWSPSTGIVDSHAFMLSLLAEAEEHGTTLAFHSEIQDAELLSDGRIGLLVSGMWLSCGSVINCAGLWADEIARTLHAEERSHMTRWQPPRQYFCKGHYFRLQGVKSPFHHLIYPLPDARGGGLGVHATLDLANQVKFGPDVSWLDANIRPDDIDYTVSTKRAEGFYESIRRYWPDLPDGALVPDYSGVRPKLSHPALLPDENQPFHDFVLAGPETHGVPNLLHLFGIESPGLTSSLALAEFIAQSQLS